MKEDEHQTPKIQNTMNATIRFDLNDADDKMAHMRCIKSLDMALALNKIENIVLENDVLTSEDINKIFYQYNITLSEIIC
jgi:hypothetical protein